MSLYHFLKSGLFGGSDLYIANWSSQRAKHYEAATYRWQGIRPEPVFTWSRKFRPRKSNLLTMTEKRKSA